MGPIVDSATGMPLRACSVPARFHAGSETMAVITLDQPASVGIAPARPRWKTDAHPLPEQLTPADLARWFDEIYQEADREHLRVPWDLGQPSPALRAWLNAEAPGLVRPGGRVAVCGCGVGHDAVELINRGYDVCAFDCSQSAINIAKRTYPQHADRFSVGDLCDPPSRFRHRFDLLVDVGTIQSAPPALWEQFVRSMVELLGPHGALLVICEGREGGTPLDEAAGPPYPPTADEVTSAAAIAGLRPTREMDDFLDDGEPPRRILRGAFTRS